ncbi:MAG: ABC transporter permease [Polyangiaceae bacterium]|nr:ABC transporter permease [Polyangiaceae bacterium]
MKTKFLPTIAPPIISLVVVLVFWETIVRVLSVPAFLLPPPSAIQAAGMANASSLIGASLTTAQSALIGFLLSIVIGISLAVVLGTSRLLERAFYPYAVFLQTVPIVAIAPLLVIWFGPGPRAVSVASFIVSVFPIMANTLTGLQSVDPALRDLFRLHGASRSQTLFLLSLPHATPNIVTGLRVAGGLSVIGAIVGEFVAGFAEGAAGLGIRILESYRLLRTDLLFAYVFCACLLGLALFGATNWLGWRLMRKWHPSEKI